jgi:hypothetical protein
MKKKRNKVFLWPTFIWTISLLAIGYFVLRVFYTTPIRLRYFDILLFTERQQKMYKTIYSKPYTELRNYQEIHFTGETKTDDIKLNFARVRISEIIQQQDTLNGIHFSFVDSTKFSNLIQALDILRKERAERYIIDNGEIWFFEEIE